MDYIVLKNSKYEAHILPELGGNVIYFYDLEQKREILRGSHDKESLKNNPALYGMPLLLPPNRIADGTFEFEGRKYQLPINEPERNNHLHGFFMTANYRVEFKEESEQKSTLVLTYIFNENDPNFTYFPHKMRIEKQYKLTKAGLELQLSIVNLTKDRVPLMFAFHTAFPLMGSREASREMNVRMSINARVKLDERLLGTEEYVSGDAIVETAAMEGFSPVAEELDNVYKVKKFGFRGAIIDYPSLNAQTIYEVDDAFHYLVVWNNGANGEILCIEPQTYRNNGINLPSWEKDGICLGAEETVRVITKLSSHKLEDSYYKKES